MRLKVITVEGKALYFKVKVPVCLSTSNLFDETSAMSVREAGNPKKRRPSGRPKKHNEITVSRSENHNEYQRQYYHKILKKGKVQGRTS